MTKIPVVVLFVPRSGILSTTAGRKNTRPWYETIFPIYFGNNIAVDPRTLTDPLRSIAARPPNFGGQF